MLSADVLSDRGFQGRYSARDIVTVRVWNDNAMLCLTLSARGHWSLDREVPPDADEGDTEELASGLLAEDTSA